jgi:hypothetical protein
MKVYFAWKQYRLGIVLAVLVTFIVITMWSEDTPQNPHEVLMNLLKKYNDPKYQREYQEYIETNEAWHIKYDNEQYLAFENFIKKYPNSQSAITAKLRLADIRRDGEAKKILEEVIKKHPRTWQAAYGRWLFGQLLYHPIGDKEAIKATLAHHIQYFEEYKLLDNLKDSIEITEFHEIFYGDQLVWWNIKIEVFSACTLHIIASRYGELGDKENKVRVYERILKEYPVTHNAEQTFLNLYLDKTWEAKADDWKNWLSKRGLTPNSFQKTREGYQLLYRLKEEWEQDYKNSKRTLETLNNLEQYFLQFPKPDYGLLIIYQTICNLYPDTPEEKAARRKAADIMLKKETWKRWREELGIDEKATPVEITTARELWHDLQPSRSFWRANQKEIEEDQKRLAELLKQKEDWQGWLQSQKINSEQLPPAKVIELRKEWVKQRNK